MNNENQTIDRNVMKEASTESKELLSNAKFKEAEFANGIQWIQEIKRSPE